MDDSSDLSFHSATWSPIKQTPTRNPLMRLKCNARRNLSQSFEDIRLQRDKNVGKSLNSSAQDIEMQLRSLTINGEKTGNKSEGKIEWMESTSEGEVLDFGPRKEGTTGSARKGIRM